MTRDVCALPKRPYILITVSETPEVQEAAGKILRFIEENKIEALNVPGPRVSGWADGHRFTFDVITRVIEGKVARCIGV